jgi:hypothetical protein
MATIRQLKWDEPIPTGEPRRYRNGSGYIRLRWLVGPNQYVEAYEHRVVMGNPHPRQHVHHIDGDKTNNDPSNLVLMTREEHAEHHGASRARSDDTVRLRKARRAAERRERLEARRQEMRRLYDEDGLTTVEIGRLMGIDPSNVSRHLRAAGAVTRTGGKSRNEIPAKSRAVVYARSQMRCERCQRDLKWGGGEIHHRRARRSRDHSPSNLIHLCSGCHRWATEHPRDAERIGLIVRVESTADPKTTPVLTYAGWRLFDDHGGIEAA